jgi:hypothetical protein
MLIKLLKNNYHAFMVCGATASYINQALANDLRAKGVKFKEKTQTLHMTCGSTDISGSMTCNMAYACGSIKMTFLVVPVMARPIILGRDFLDESRVWIDISSGGWFLRDKPDYVIPFTTPDYKQPHFVELTESWVDKVCAGIVGENRDKQGMRDIVNKYRSKGLFSKSPGVVKGVEH